MAKKKNDRRQLPVKYSSQSIPTSSSTEFHSDATLGPESSSDSPTNIGWASSESTSAPAIGEEEKPRESYAQSTPALIDKYVFSRDFLPFALVAIGMGWVFIQDNGAGNLKTFGDLLWTMEKCAAILVLFLIMLFLQWLYKKNREQI